LAEYVPAALFVYTKETEDLIGPLQENPLGVNITPIAFETLMQNPQEHLETAGHVVVSGALDVVKTILEEARTYGFSVGLIPTPTQKDLAKFFRSPRLVDQAIELALQKDAHAVDLTRCNGKIVLYKATLGRIPLIDAPADVSRLGILTEGFKKLIGLRLLRFSFKTAEEQKIETAASGCMIVQHHKGSLASRLISHDSSLADRAIAVVIAAPVSIVDYLTFLAQTLTPGVKPKGLPSAIGLIKSRQVLVESETELDVFIDGERATKTPLQCETEPEAVRINVPQELTEESTRSQSGTETLRIDHLPRGKEVAKATARTIPFFSYASEERFRDLFSALREDAKTNGIYLALMVLSTMLATVGLYLNSASVVIGAMLLAPLMTPLVSLAMGLLRYDTELLKNSLNKTLIGIVIALMASALITLLFPHKPVTAEMEGRLNPTLLDLAVAVISGIAAAYSKSFKEIVQSLAGVAIAVALVPPLAVAGIGIGRADFHFFSQAFLLFSTNLVGIILAATFTFRFLGYSPVVRGKRSLGVVLLSLALISIPLYLSYDRIVEKMVVEENWQRERFLVNGKYIIIQSADISRRGDKEIVVMDLLAREPLTRQDLTEFKRKVQTHFTKKLIIRARIFYIP
jgi:uncharacterized hydrophobic protein (TIGR00271 family)